MPMGVAEPDIPLLLRCHSAGIATPLNTRQISCVVSAVAASSQQVYGSRQANVRFGDFPSNGRDGSEPRLDRHSVGAAVFAD